MFDHWRLPGPSRWLKAISDDRAAGSSGAVICPARERPPDLVAALADATSRGMSHFEVAAGDAGYVTSGEPATAHIRLLRVLIDQLGLECSPDPQSFVTDPKLGRTSILIDARSEELPVQSSWLRLLRDVADASRSTMVTSRPTIWVLAAVVDDQLPWLPRADVSLTLHWYWGVLNAVDAIVAAADVGLDDEVTACAMEIVRWDLDLLADLGDWDGTVANLRSRSLRLPAGPWAAIDASVAAAERPPDSSVAAWSRGTLESWDKHLQAHLAVDHDDESALARRIWAGQVARILPFIEHERARLAAWFAEQVDRHGGVDEAWAKEHGDDIAALEIGPLWACVHAHRSVRVPQPRFELLRDLKDARNAVAHRRPVPTATARDLRRRAALDRRSD